MMVTDSLAWIVSHGWTVIMAVCSGALGIIAADRFLIYWFRCEAAKARQEREQRIVAAGTPRCAGVRIAEDFVMDAKHTPGPWKIGFWGGQCHNPQHVAAKRHPGPPECVYEPQFNEGYGGIAGVEPHQMVVGTNYDEVVISEADAHLIAAAPELLEMVKRLQLAISDCADPRDELFFEAKALIAKAEGR